METELGSTGSTGASLDYKVTGRRIVAALIDVGILVVLFLVMAAAFGDFGETSDERGTDSFRVGLNGGPAALYFALTLAYFIVLEGLAARTLGKLVMGLRVVKVDGGRADWGAVILRNILRIIDGLPVLYIVGLITVAVTEKNQRLGDLAGGTLIVRAD